MSGHDLNLLALGVGLGVYLTLVVVMLNGLAADYRQAKARD